ncbi:hypothetical protein RF679_16955 [Undibacterium cyanobacteriorum]|uniref:STAS/SEC14 domain-containing protein n=1 Tax=Undibacterium cyanobacteriorum TaxID=3073561 RepID=A0ABY9RGG1_9BURK|nr:hypothetical protein [Undibacterium sp. 20NA77.5]WMW80317.1 hypothetical protein RF679_16955 [Undibacterium sp. 20NA77.5]
MRFIPKPHGEFKIQWQGDVFFVEYFDVWNDITARQLLQASLPLWEEHGGKPWGLLSDARQWAGATPEAIEAWWHFFEVGVKHGMVAFTGLLPSELHVRLVETLSQRAQQLVPYERSLDLAAAYQWLEQHGIASTSAP